MAQRSVQRQTGFQGQQPMVGQTVTRQQTIINNYLAINQTSMNLILRHMRPLPANASQTQRQQAMTQLFNLIRIGGTLGFTYSPQAGRQPRTPDQVLSNRSGDCDELAMLYVAAARRLNIPLTGVSMAGMQLHTSGGRRGHAALFFRGTSNYVLDFTFGSFTQVSDFTSQTIQNLYRGKTLIFGAGTAGVTVNSLASMQTFGTLGDMVATQLIQQSDYFCKRAGTSGVSTSRLQNLDSARRYVEMAAALGSANAFVTGNIRQQALSVFDGYHNMGEISYNARHYRNALAYYERALRFYGNVSEIRTQRASAVYDIHEARGLSYQSLGKRKEALAEFTQMVRLRPTGWSGNRKKMSMEITLAQAAISRRDWRTAKTYILAAERTGRLALQNIPRTPANATHRQVIYRTLLRLRGYMRRRGWTALP